MIYQTRSPNLQPPSRASHWSSQDHGLLFLRPNPFYGDTYIRIHESRIKGDPFPWLWCSRGIASNFMEVFDIIHGDFPGTKQRYATARNPRGRWASGGLSLKLGKIRPPKTTQLVQIPDPRLPTTFSIL